MKRRTRARPAAPRLPAGAVLRRVGDEAQWSVCSRGDRVHGRTFAAARGGRSPVVILCSSDGRAAGELALRARSLFAPHAALAVFDLPLCGSRQSDKLSAQAFDERQPLAARLRPDLEAQTGADLEAVVALLRADPELDPERVSLVGVGLGAELARAFASGGHGLRAVVLEERPAPGDDWLRAVAASLARG